MAFAKAKKQGIWLKVLLFGPSGSGKTYSSLILASAIASQCGSRVCVIDSEAGRANYYADEFDFDVYEDFTDHTPEGYSKAIKEALAAGYKVIVVDSLTHEWTKLNEIHDAMPGNSFVNWGPLKKRHNAFLELLLNCDAHVICTARGKDEYQMDTNDRGKVTPKKVGMGVTQDKDLQYNFTVTYSLDQKTHVASVDKDNTHTAEGRYDVLTAEDGIKLYKWATEDGTPKTTPHSIEQAAAPNGSQIDVVINDIMSKAMELYKDPDKKEKVKELMAQYCPSGNPKKMTDIDKANELLNILNGME